MMGKLQIKRVYLPVTSTDGKRILIDRLWPRGISKTKACLDEWNKEIAPSNELRKWFQHDPEKFAEFKQKYLDELKVNPSLKEFVIQIKQALQQENVTLLFSAKDELHNNAVVLQDYLNNEVK